MYKRILFTIMMLCVGVGFANAQTSRIPYAVLDEGTLTFYYDWDMSNRQGTKFEIDKTNPEPVWKTNESVPSITKVKFDDSFYNFLPKSTASWFSELTNLTEVEDPWYLNTTETENMSSMFAGCINLKSLYVGALFTSAVKNVSAMFNSCSSLETLDGIDANTVDVSNVVDMTGMFAGCTSLKSLDLGKFQTVNVVNMADMFFNCSSLEELDVYGFFNTQSVTNMGGMFEFCSSLTSLDLSTFSTAQVTNMSFMFYGCSQLTSLNLNGFDTSLVRNMRNMFYDCSSLTSLDLSSFRTGSVTNMSHMFRGCSSLTSLNLSSFNTAQVTDMNFMFCDCSSLTSLNLSTFNTAQVTNMMFMFDGCKNLGNIVVGKSWNTSNVESSGYMFHNCNNLVGGAGTIYDAECEDKTYAHVDEGTENPGYLSYEAYAVYDNDNNTLTFWYNDEKAIWPETNVYEISEDSPAWYGLPITRVTFTSSFANTRPKSNFHWFFELSGLTEIEGIENLNTSCSTNMSGMFRGCSSLTSLDLSNFDTSSVTDMSYMFNGCTSLTSLNLNGFETSLVRNMIYMFYDCSSLTSLDLSSFITGNVTSMLGMFSECTSLTSLKMNFSTDNVEDMSLMFYGCSSLTSLDLSSFNTSKVTDMMSMFNGCNSLTSLNLNGFETSLVRNMSGMFYDCRSLTSLDLSSFDTSNVTVMYSMFFECNSLTSLDVSNFNTSKVTNMNSMFSKCNSLTSLNLSNFRTGSVTNMGNMFGGCSKLTTLNQAFSTQEVTEMSFMFNGCSSLTSLDLTGFNTAQVTDMSWMFGGCEKLTTILVSASNEDATFWDTSSVTSSDGMFNDCSKLKGYQGTAYDSSHEDVAYARIDGGTSNPGYLSVISYGIRVNGKIVDIVNKNDVLGDGKVTFDGAGTLTLNGANLTSMSVTSTATTADDGWVHIVVNGECSLTALATGALPLYKNTVMEGTGSLAITQGNNTTKPGYGIRMYASSDLTVKDIDLTIRAGKQGILGYKTGNAKVKYFSDIRFENANCHITIYGNNQISDSPGSIIDANSITLKGCAMTTGTIVTGTNGQQSVTALEMIIERTAPVVTAIENARDVQPFDASAPLYNLQGQRVSHPVKGHIYTQKGRKYRF